MQKADLGSIEVVEQARLHWGERLVWGEAVVEGEGALLPKSPGVHAGVGWVSL